MELGTEILDPLGLLLFLWTFGKVARVSQMRRVVGFGQRV